MLACRLEAVLPSIVADDQTGFIKGRHSFFLTLDAYLIFFMVPLHPTFQKYYYHLMPRRRLIGWRGIISFTLLNNLALVKKSFPGLRFCILLHLQLFKQTVTSPPTSLTIVAPDIDFSLFPLKVSPQKFKYLGIWITPVFQDLFKANFLPLLANLKRDMERWSLLPLSLGGRINITKMNVLPKFLYIFQCIPLNLSKSFFMSVDNLVSGFIWTRKTLEYGKGSYNNILNMEDYPSLTSSFSIGLPTLGLCYFGKTLHLMTPPLSGYEWKTPCLHISLHSLLCSKLPLLDSISKVTSNPIVKHSFKILTQFRRSFSLKDLPTCAPITKNHHHQFMPSIIDGAFRASRGVATIENLFTDNSFASFDQLKLKIQLPELSSLDFCSSVVSYQHHLLTSHPNHPIPS